MTELDDLIKLRDELEKLREMLNDGFCSGAAAEILFASIDSHVALLEAIRKDELEVK